jgi:hypothetical protein
LVEGEHIVVHEQVKGEERLFKEERLLKRAFGPNRRRKPS